MLVLVTARVGCDGEAGLSEHDDANDEAEPENLEWDRGKLGVAGEGDATSDDEELCV